MRPLYRQTKLLIQGLAELVFPRICLLCRRGVQENAEPGDCICAGCWDKIRENSGTAHSVQEGPGSYDQIVSPALYDGAVKELIRHFKYHGKQHLGRQLSSLMLESIRSSAPQYAGVDAVVPMPLHPRRRKERTFNQASILGQHIAASLKVPLLEHALVRTRYTRPQVTLAVNDRVKNILGCFAVPETALVRGKTLLLVDDVVTTGATVTEAAGCLKRAGATKVFVATIAK